MHQEYDRAKLLEEVWAEPVQIVALRYQLSDVGLKKLCNRLLIPTPPRGYWAKLKAGRMVPGRPELKPYKGNPRHLYRFVAQPMPPTEGNAPVDERLEPVLAFERDPANYIQVSSRGTRWHHLVAATRDTFNAGYKDNRGIPLPRGKGLDIAVSAEQRMRALRVMNALIKALEKRGFKLVPGDHRVEVEMFGVRLPLSVFEATKRANYEPTAKQVAAKSRGEYSYWPPYRYTPTGKLEIRCGDGGAVIKDSARAPIEEQLNQAVVLMARCAIGTLRYHEEQERRSQIRETRRMAALALQATQDTEKKKLEQLIVDAQRWQQAEAIRAFLKAQEAESLEKSAHSDQLLAHLTWARAKADWLDPLVRRPDAILDQKIDIYY
jgi:hypothetical protein